MQDCPEYLDNAKVICYTHLDDRHEHTGRVSLFADGNQQLDFSSIAIATYGNDSEFYIFFCNENWDVENDILASSLELAKKQAELVFSDIKNDWITK